MEMVGVDYSSLQCCAASRAKSTVDNVSTVYCCQSSKVKEILWFVVLIEGSNCWNCNRFLHFVSIWKQPRQ